MRYNKKGSIKVIVILILLGIVGGWWYLNYSRKGEKLSVEKTQQLQSENEQKNVNNIRIEKERLVFLDENGNEIKAVPFLKYDPGRSSSKVYLSKNEKYIALNNIYEYKTVGGYEQVEKAEVTVLNRKGEELWKMEQQFYDFNVSTNGKYILGKDFEREAILILNDKGIIDITLKNKKGGIDFTLKEDWRGWTADFSKEGNFFAVVLRIIKNDDGERKMIDNLFVLDENGNELWRKEKVIPSGAEFYGLEISDNDIITVLLGPSFEKSAPVKKYRFDKQGNLL